ncbi:hypothetical protein [uncultured Algoriphagus sp.]|uniref:hypothetical protein n=1 Tax=uncultured Algoriphagus sp. TaxID=417365 RepID=UPI0030EBF152
MEIVLAFFVYFLIVFGICSIQFRNGGKFENIIIVYIFFISIYAILKTNGESLYWAPFVLIIISIFKLDLKFKLSYPKIDDIVSSIVIWGLFFGLYFVLNNFKFGVFHEDYIIYSRIAHYNDVIGVENTKSIYNVFQSDISNEVYHFSELWGIAILRCFTSLSLLVNYVFVLAPIFSFIIYLGFKDVFPSSNFWIALLAIIILLFVSSPYDKLVRLFDMNLPMLGVGDSILTIKNIFIIPIFLYLFISLRIDNFNFLKLSILIFMYPLVIPVVVPSICIYFLVVNKYPIKYYCYPIFVILFFFVYSFIFSSGAQLLNISNFFNYSVLAKVFFIGLCVGSSIFFINWKLFNSDKEDKDYYFISIIIIIISLLLWVLFYQNINSNQFFRNTFHSLICIQITYIIVNNLFRMKYLVSVLLIVVFIVPFVFNDFNFVVDSLAEENIDISSLTKNSNIVFIPDINKEQSIYDYIDYMYNDLNTFYFHNEYLNILSVSGSFPISEKIDSRIELDLLSYYRGFSPFFNTCGELSLNNLSCLRSFCLDHNVEFIISNIKNGPLEINNPKIFLGQYYIYNVKNF